MPVHVIPCREGRITAESVGNAAGFWGSVHPAAWSFMLAARLRGSRELPSDPESDPDAALAETFDLSLAELALFDALPRLQTEM